MIIHRIEFDFFQNPEQQKKKVSEASALLTWETKAESFYSIIYFRGNLENQDNKVSQDHMESLVWLDLLDYQGRGKMDKM